MSTVDLTSKIPNNVNLDQDKRLMRALEQWQPNYLGWWREMGPAGFQETDAYLRTAVSVDAEGWAHFDYVKMPDYRWGIFLADASKAKSALAHEGAFRAKEALAAGLVTFAPDDIDWDDEVRLAVEERSSLSPDALTGMEANLRFAGPETMETKIFGRLSAWQNWIFQRPNAVGERGALSLYGKPLRPEFDWRRT